MVVLWFVELLVNSNASSPYLVCEVARKAYMFHAFIIPFTQRAVIDNLKASSLHIVKGWELSQHAFPCMLAPTLWIIIPPHLSSPSNDRVMRVSSLPKTLKLGFFNSLKSNYVKDGVESDSTQGHNKRLLQPGNGVYILHCLLDGAIIALHQVQDHAFI